MPGDYGMIEITALKDINGGACYSQTIKLLGNDFTVSIGKCEL